MANIHEQWTSLWQLVDQTLQGLVVLEEVVGVDESTVVLCGGVVLGSVAPLATVCVVVTDGTPSLRQQVLIAAMSQLDDAKPVTKTHPQVYGEVLPVNLAVERFRLIEALEVGGDLRLLLDAIVQEPEPLDELNALVVLKTHERFLGHNEIQLIQSCFGQEPPQPRVRVGLNVVESVLEVGNHGQDVPGIAQALRFKVQQHLFPWVFRVLNHLIDQHTLDLQVLERAEVSVR
mmetsp:Transcript_23180/g.54250  ORF Transcript_23180/g.54250 Transcript_23180/m.54250 type:complete len:232 (-) Transcript_23180:1810-2505(-)